MNSGPAETGPETPLSFIGVGIQHNIIVHLHHGCITAKTLGEVPLTGKMACTHGHWMDPACSRRTPYLHRLFTVSVRLRTVIVRIGNTLTTGT